MKTKLTLLLLLGGLVSSSLAQSKDYVYPHDGPLIAGKIQSVDADGIQIDEKGKVRRLAVDQISKVRFSDDPSGLNSVRSAVDAGHKLFAPFRNMYNTLFDYPVRCCTLNFAPFEQYLAFAGFQYTRNGL